MMPLSVREKTTLMKKTVDVEAEVVEVAHSSDFIEVVDIFRKKLNVDILESIL